MYNVTYSLFMGKMWWDNLSQNEKCYSLAVGHRGWNISNYLSLNVQCYLLPVAIGHKKKMWWDSWDWHSQNVWCHSLAVGHRKYIMRLSFTLKMWNVTHILLIIGKDVMRLPSTKCMCNVIHMLLIIGKDVMRLPFTKWAMSLTCYWS